MNQKQARHHYYFRGLLPCFIAFLSIYYFKATLLSISSFLICYLWPYFLYTPGAKEKYLEFKYRKSFVGLLVRLDEFLKGVLRPKKMALGFLISISTSLIFCMVMWIFSGAGEPLFALAGSCLFTIVYYYLLYNFSNLSFEGDTETLQGELPLETSSEPSQNLQSHQTDSDSNS